jgi:hypothetical protein
MVFVALRLADPPTHGVLPTLSKIKKLLNGGQGTSWPLAPTYYYYYYGFRFGVRLVIGTLQYPVTTGTVGR